MFRKSIDLTRTELDNLLSGKTVRVFGSIYGNGGYLTISFKKRMK